MDIELIMGIGGGFFVIVGLLFLSGIHIFMIPKDILERDTKPRVRPEEQVNSASVENGAAEGRQTPH